jgi:hypothetical protein
MSPKRQLGCYQKKKKGIKKIKMAIIGQYQSMDCNKSSTLVDLADHPLILLFQ